MISNEDKDHSHSLQASVRRKVVTADGKRRKMKKQTLFESTRCETTREPTSPKHTTLEYQKFGLYKDDFYEKRNMSPGYRYNTSYIGNEIKDNSSKISAPKYTIAKSSREPISSEKRHFDVGCTSPVPDRHVKKKSPRATIGNYPRFKQTYLKYKASKRVPHSYLSNLKEILGAKSISDREFKQQTLTNPHNLGVASTIPKSLRFNTFRNTGPGPADYNIKPGIKNNNFNLGSFMIKVKSKSTKRRKYKTRNSIKSESKNVSTFGHPYKCGNKIWFEEYDKAFLNKEGPGPARYKPNHLNQSMHMQAPQYKFSRAERWNASVGNYKIKLLLNIVIVDFQTKKKKSKSRSIRSGIRSNRLSRNDSCSIDVSPDNRNLHSSNTNRRKVNLSSKRSLIFERLK